MNNSEKFSREMQQYFAEGLIKEIFRTGELSICNLADAQHAAFPFDVVDKKTNMQVGFLLTEQEFPTFMEEPTVENLKWLNYATVQKREQRDFILNSKLVEKLRVLQSKIRNQNIQYIDPEVERQIVEAAKEKLQSAPGMKV